MSAPGRVLMDQTALWPWHGATRSDLDATAEHWCGARPEEQASDGAVRTAIVMAMLRDEPAAEPQPASGEPPAQSQEKRKMATKFKPGTTAAQLQARVGARPKEAATPAPRARLIGARFRVTEGGRSKLQKNSVRAAVFAALKTFGKRGTRLDPLEEKLHALAAETGDQRLLNDPVPHLRKLLEAGHIEVME